MATVTVFGDLFSAKHENGYGHPESPRRFSALLSRIQEKKWLLSAGELHRVRDKLVDPTLVHDVEYINQLYEIFRSFPETSSQHSFLVQLDEDTFASKESLDVALLGLALEEQGIDLLFKGTNSEPNIPFILTRPPGHHARPGASMGFCIFANVAYAARYAQQKYGVKRVAIFDWDVHHGNGTEEIFYNDPSVLTISLHAYPFWPEGYGEPEKRGGGSNLNLPMPIEAGDKQYLQYMDKYVVPQVAAFEPELIIVAAGFDAHRLERNSGLQSKILMGVSENTFSYMTFRLHELAKRLCNSRILFSLEGGYYLPSLLSGVEAVIDTLQSERVIEYPGFTHGDNMDTDIFSDYVKRIEKSLG